MDSEIELFAAEYKALVERRKQHKLSASEFLNRNSKQSVIAPGIAGHDRRVAISAGSVSLDNLTLERVLEVYQFGLVEFKKSHILYIIIC
jgi:hypothetical protein